MAPRRLSALALATALLALVLAGCVETRDARGTGADERNGGDGVQAEPTPATALAVRAEAPYSFAPKTLSAGSGTLVELTFTNADPLARHDWVLADADASSEVVGDGASDSIVFVAPPAGTYQFYCSVGNHRALGMVGTFRST